IGASGVGKASALANNISEALITTAGGLVVAIPALAAFFFFRNRITETMVAVEDEIGELIEQF
ncbi:MotA/TolQ/ExbB proton channel family protein, partial [bacterium]|nr:MotA/TolQ/ExbB proton channel family protein [bacterium]